MGSYRARDLLLVPSLLSLTRLPLAALFPAVVHRPGWALAVLFAAALSDVLDGWYARRYGQATATGAVIDGITDKSFAASVVLSLVLHGSLTGWQAALLAVRELGELPLVLWWALHRHRRQRRAEAPHANWAGKLATVIQFMAVAAALFALPGIWIALATTALTGALAAASYWRRELRA